MAIVVESVTMTQNTSNTVNLVFDMPATRPDGDLYLLLFGMDGISSPVRPAGWTQLLSDAAPIGQVYSNVSYRVGSSEPATYTFTHGSQQSRAVVLRISGAGTPLLTFDKGTGATAAAPAASPTPASDSLIVRSWVCCWINPPTPPDSTSLLPLKHI